jgi:alkylation response protein AidB-like acyl-CoA dehydrogenase
MGKLTKQVFCLLALWKIKVMRASLMLTRLSLFNNRQNQASMAKYWASGLECKIVDECLRLHGGYGYMNEYPIAQMYCDSRVQ